MVLDDLLNKSQEKCNKKLNEYLEDAKKEGIKFNKLIHDEKVFVDYLNHLKYFVDNDLVPNATIRLKNFQKFILRSQTMIDQNKNFGTMSKEQ